MRPKSGRVLIVGSMVVHDKPDRRLLFDDALGVDMRAGPGVDLVHDFEQPIPSDLVGAFDHVECMSVLEHTARPWLVAENVIRAMRIGASLFVSVPFVWRVHGYPDDFWRMTANGVRALFGSAILWDSVRYCAETLITPGEKLPAVKIGNDHPYLPRMETAAFGHRIA